MGNPIGVWTIDDWHRIDNNASTSLWLDHSISVWSVTETQWHLNEYSAFRGFCENNGLSPMLYKFLDNEGNVKQQYIQMDNGIEHDHKQAMALHKWNRPEPAVYNGQHVTTRVGTTQHWSRHAVGNPTEQQP
eukprot:2408562-Amphidinium_carterae.1